MAESLVIADSFAYYADAATAKALLEADGIAAFLDNAYSSDVWTGCIGQVRVQVPASELARAKKLLAELRTSNRTLAERGSAVADDACLRCGQTLSKESDRCARCGFEPGGEELAEYVNGPVPDSLLPHVYSPLDTRRFALRPELVRAYVDFCEREGVEIRGWQVWAHSTIGHVMLDVIEQGGARELLAAAARVPAERQWDTYFSVNAVRRPAEQEREA